MKQILSKLWRSIRSLWECGVIQVSDGRLYWYDTNEDKEWILRRLNE